MKGVIILKDDVGRDIQPNLFPIRYQSVGGKRYRDEMDNFLKFFHENNISDFLVSLIV